MRDADPRTKKAMQRLIRHPSLAVKTLAADLGVTYSTLHSWAAPDGPVPTLAQVRQVVWAAARQDPEAARALALDLFGLGDAGWVLTAIPAPAPSTAGLERDAMEVSVAVGAMQEATIETASDGVITLAEAALVDARTERVIREAVDIRERMRMVMRPRLPLTAAVSA